MSSLAPDRGVAGEPNFPATAHAIHLDHKVSLQGLYDSGANRTYWQFDFPYLPTRACHLLTGAVFAPIRVGGTYQYYTTGDYSGGQTVFGRTETFDIYFSRLFPRDDQGRVLHGARLQVRHFTVHWVHTVAFDVISYDAPTPQQFARASYMRRQLLDPLNDENYGVADTGSFRHWIGMNAERVRLAIFNNTVRPCTIVGVEYDAKPMGGIR